VVCCARAGEREEGEAVRVGRPAGRGAGRGAEVVEGARGRESAMAGRWREREEEGRKEGKR